MQLQETLSAVAAGKETVEQVSAQVTSDRPPKIAFLFTGQGAQYPDTGRQLYETQPNFRQIIDRCDRILRPYLEIPLLEVLYPANGKHSPINETAYTQPALFAIEYALAELWQSWGIKPDVVMGHSVGEYVAAFDTLPSFIEADSLRLGLKGIVKYPLRRSKQLTLMLLSLRLLLQFCCFPSPPQCQYGTFNILPLLAPESRFAYSVRFFVAGISPY